jgi:very-short-patch-repair endonuclease
MAADDASGLAAGFTVLRFSDHEVLKGMKGVIAYLEEWIEKYEASKTTP